MSTVNKSHFVLSLCLLSFVGAGAVRAAPPIGDGQEQARLLVSGRSFPSNDSKYRSIALRSVASKSVGLDAQEQARQMISGPVIRETFTSAGASGNRSVEVDALELARRMILGSQAGSSPTKARLARRTE
jgi:hypothetical protein